jgi:Pyruvate/2-oxoacid:ferredoxin oxidoreductase gamma subunit
MVMLGALLDRVPVLTLDALDRALDNHMPARRRDLLAANKLALRKGIELAQRAVLIPA